MRATVTAAALVLTLAAGPALAAKAVIAVTALESGSSLGTIEAVDGKQGLVLKPKLFGLPAGPHGIHLHQNGDCSAKEQDGKLVPGLAAGGHFDPKGSSKHMGPWSEGGHQGDLPALAVNGDGTATDPLVVPRLKVADLKGRAIVIHAGADNYADEPKPLGGGGPRIACGIVK
ncbi:MAG: superoxide dismutase family protein [Rhodospirillaceae bacterium]|nr:superoxide dismutase family protein [Rhodospirillales bacterium]